MIYGWPELLVAALEVGAVAFCGWRLYVAARTTWTWKE